MEFVATHGRRAHVTLPGAALIRAALRLAFSASFPMHALLVAVLYGVGGNLLLPAQTFASPAYVWFVRTWPHSENAWGVLLCALATFGALGILAKRREWKLASVILLAVGHVVYAQGLFEGGGSGAGRFTYSLLAGAAIFLIAKIGQEGVR